MKNTRKLIIAAMLCALAVVFKIFVSFDFAPTVRASITPIPVMMCGIIFGPIFGGICGVITDILGYVVKPTGSYFPGLTLTMALYGVIPGLFFLKKPINKTLKFVLAGVATAITQLFCSFFLNTFWFSDIKGTPFMVEFAQRVLSSSIHLGVYTVLIVVLYGVYINFIEPRLYQNKL